MIKKCIGVLTILMVAFVVMSPVKAVDENQTLQDLIDQLNAKKAELNKVNNDKELTEDRINEITSNVKQISNDIITIENNIEKLNEEIEELNTNITLKDEEMKRIINQYQLSNGDNAYLEYVMGASTVTDFIFRASIVEQLTSHNKDLINDMNDMINESEAKSAELATEKINITQKRVSLINEQLKLGSKQDELNDHAISLSEEINDAIKTINNYEKIYGCKPSDKIKDCTSVANSKNFVRPAETARITNEFGAGVSGIYSSHSGIDMSTAGGSKVFAAAAGNVVYVKQLNVSYLKSALAGKSCAYSPNRYSYPSDCSCGGNYVIIQHVVNGVSYATRYLHLNTVNVKVGDRVTAQTVIGTFGGNEFYERCSTGVHLHFEVAVGVYASDFWSFTYGAGAVINPRKVINFPSLGSLFYGRF